MNIPFNGIKVLNDGFVGLVDSMGDDSAIVQAARISYGKDKREHGKEEVNKDRALIRYLMRHRHTTPFEMVELKFIIRIPMDAWRQMVRHRTASINEYSTRYTEAIDSCQTTDPEEWRLQSGNNKQGSDGFLKDWPEDVPLNLRFLKGLNSSPGQALTKRELDHKVLSKELYKSRIALGVAKEQARKDLPLSTYTEAYWKIDLHNLFHFLSLRLDAHAQLEIRQYAQAIYELIKPIVPIACQAFEDFRLNGAFFSAQELTALKEGLDTDSDPAILYEITEGVSKREAKEFKEKLWTQS